jgi:zinc and cadmium transporter
MFRAAAHKIPEVRKAFILYPSSFILSFRHLARYSIAMSPVKLLSIYCAAVFFASLAGGWLPFFLRLTHVRLQLAMSFVGGAMLGVGVLHLLPHAYFAFGHEIYPPVVWLLAGFLAMFFVERVFHFHHHDAPPEAVRGCGEHEGHDYDGHAHAAGHQHSRQPEVEHEGHQPGRLTWGAALMGLALHSLLDGVALAVSVLAETDEGAVESGAGLVVFLVIVLHKPFDSLTLGTLMAIAGRPAAARHTVNALYALAAPIGALACALGAQYGTGGQAILGPALAFAAGMFICIATSDLLPELQFHSHDRVKLSAALLLGISLAGVLVWVEAHGHAHEHSREQAVGSRQ